MNVACLLHLMDSPGDLGCKSQNRVLWGTMRQSASWESVLPSLDKPGYSASISQLGTKPHLQSTLTHHIRILQNIQNKNSQIKANIRYTLGN